MSRGGYVQMAGMSRGWVCLGGWYVWGGGYVHGVNMSRVGVSNHCPCT